LEELEIQKAKDGHRKPSEKDFEIKREPHLKKGEEV